MIVAKLVQQIQFTQQRWPKMQGCNTEAHKRIQGQKIGPSDKTLPSGRNQNRANRTYLFNLKFRVSQPKTGKSIFSD